MVVNEAEGVVGELKVIDRQLASPHEQQRL